MRIHRDFKDYHVEKLREPEETKVYLSAALDAYERDGNIEVLLLALRDVAEARAGIGGDDAIKALHQIMSDVQSRNKDIDPETLEKEVAEAIREVRKQKRHEKSRNDN